MPLFSSTLRAAISSRGVTSIGLADNGAGGASNLCATARISAAACMRFHFLPLESVFSQPAIRAPNRNSEGA